MLNSQLCYKIIRHVVDKRLGGKPIFLKLVIESHFDLQVEIDRIGETVAWVDAESELRANAWKIGVVMVGEDTVLPAYCDTVGSKENCHNKQMSQ